MNDGRTGVALLEDSIALVRSAPARAWTWYLAGAVPFFAALVFFVQATTGPLRVPDPAPVALGLAILFGWRQVTRAVFGRILYSLTAETSASQSARLIFRGVARAWFAGFLKLLCPFPVPWTTALFRNYQAYAWEEEKPFRRAAEASASGSQDFLAWLILGAMSLFLWANVFSALVAGPMLYRTFTGEEGILTRHMDALFNRTTALASLSVTWCLCDTVLEAMYSLRRYQSESASTGADLLQAWRRSTVKSALAFVALFAFIGVQAQPVYAQPEATPRQASLDRAIDRALAQPQHQWREGRTLAAEQDPLILRWMKGLVEGVKRMVKRITAPIRRAWERLLDWLRKGNGKPSTTGSGAPVDGLRLAAAIAILLFAVGFVVLLLRPGSRKTSAAIPAGSAALPIDLSDPSLSATDLPEDEWLALSRDWMEKGDARMAMRALFLASLAFLHRRELVSIRGHKSNRDYLRELGLRGRAIAGLQQEFAGHIRSFEGVWYGSDPVDIDHVSGFAATFDRMKGMCA